MSLEEVKALLQEGPREETEQIDEDSWVNNQMDKVQDIAAMVGKKRERDEAAFGASATSTLKD